MKITTTSGREEYDLVPAACDSKVSEVFAKRDGLVFRVAMGNVENVVLTGALTAKDVKEIFKIE